MSKSLCGVVISAACAGCTVLVSTNDLAGDARVDGGAPSGDSDSGSHDSGEDGSTIRAADAGAPDASPVRDPLYLFDAESVTSGAGTRVSATFARAVRAGDTVVCFAFTNAAGVTSFTDSAGDTLERVEGPILFGGYTHELWYASSSRGADALTVEMVTNKSDVLRGVSCHAYEGSLALVGTRREVFSEAGAGVRSATAFSLPAPTTTGILFAFWGSFGGVTVASGWTQRSTIDGDYLGDRAIRAGESVAMEATCTQGCVLLGAAFAR